MTAGLRRWLLRSLNALWPRPGEGELSREIASHLALLEENFRRQGLPPEAARRAARRAFGGVEQAKALHRDARSFIWIDDARRDARYAIRGLAKTPGFTTVTVLTLALGIGANTAIFSLVKAVLLEPLPVHDPAGLVLVGDGRGSGVATGQQESFRWFSVDLYNHLRATPVFDGLAAVQSGDMSVAARYAGPGTAESARARLVSGNYFDVLGVRAALGRTIRPDDDERSAPAVTVVSYRYWRDRLHGDPGIVGAVVALNNVGVTIVGVAPEPFFGDRLEPDPPSFWIPIAADRQLNPELTVVDSPSAYWLYAFGRLRPETGRPAAEAALGARIRGWLTALEGGVISDERQDEISRSRVELTPLGRGIGHMRSEYAFMLQLSIGLSALVLLIASANVANLLLARGASSRVEYAVRLALGASRGRIVRQSLAASLVLALTGGVIGIAFAAAAARGLLALVFVNASFIPITTMPDGPILAFAIALSCMTALLFGLLPAVRSSTDMPPILSASGRAATSARTYGRSGWGRALVIGQVALSLVVIATAGALWRSLTHLAEQPLGYHRDRVLVVNVDPVRAGYAYGELPPLYSVLLERLNAVPGVASVALSYYTPFNGCCWAFSVGVAGYTPSPGERTRALLNRVSPTYFETVGTRLIDGRGFDARDTPTAPPVAVVNEEFVRRFSQGRRPIGGRFGIGANEERRNDIEIVGVVENAKYEDPWEPPQPMAFLPLLQPDPGESAVSSTASSFIGTIEIRAAGAPFTVAAGARRALAEIDPNLPVLQMETIAQSVDRALSRERAVAALAAVSGVIALALTAVGLYGVTAYRVRRRTSEFGVRLALGAPRRSVVGMVLREVLQEGCAGVLVGLPILYVMLRSIDAWLFGVAAIDPLDSAVAAMIIAVSLAAAALTPALRASRISPIEAIRQG